MSKTGGKCVCYLCDLQGSGTCIIEATKTGRYSTQPTDVHRKREEIAPSTTIDSDYTAALFRAWQAGDSGGMVSFADFIEMETERSKVLKVGHSGQVEEKFTSTNSRVMPCSLYNLVTECNINGSSGHCGDQPCMMART